MNKAKIDYLVSQSYKRNDLDIAKTDAVRQMLNKSDFKEYINALKKKENKNNIIILSPVDITDKKMFEEKFPNRKIIYRIDPSLIAGVKIIDNDIIYEMSLKSSLEGIIDSINKTYD
jgi:F0F1-type ATP synthase delta subunit